MGNHLALRASHLGGLVRHRTVRYLLAGGVLLLTFICIPDDVTIVAQTKTTKTVKVFNGRAQVTVPKTTKNPRKLYSNVYLAQPTDKKKKFAVYLTRDSLGADERNLSSKVLGEQIKRNLEGQGYTVISLKPQGLNFTANIKGYVEVPWQKVGTAPVRGLAKFTRTADRQLIGAILLCDPGQWKSSGINDYKTAVVKTKVSRR